MGFQFLPKSVTLKDLERVMNIILRYFTKFGKFEANYVTVVVTPILPVTEM